MPTKAVAGWTQIAVVQQDIREIHIVALDAAATQFQLSVIYNVYDDQGVLRIANKSLSQQTSTAPGAPFLSAVLAAVNGAEGT